MGKIIAIANHKGGVGKTTSVANIGAALARKGKRVLLLDLDAQQNLTFFFLKEDEVETSIYDALRGEAALPIVNVKENLDLTPSSIDLARAELDLSGRIAREYILKNLLADVKDNYDYILLDCPPSLGIITYNALVAATDLYIVLTAEALPYKGLTMLEEVVGELKALNKDLEVSGVFITRYNNRSLNNIVVEQIRERYGSKVFSTKIRENIAVAEAPLMGKDIFSYAPECNGAKDYEALTDEIIKRMEKDDAIFFFKEFGGDYGYSVGEFVGEPNEDGEQNYRGYSFTRTKERVEFSILHDREDFLSEDEVEQLREKEDDMSLHKISRDTFLKIGQLYEETAKKLSALGYESRDFLNMEEIEDLPDEEKRSSASDILDDAVWEAMRITGQA